MFPLTDDNEQTDVDNELANLDNEHADVNNASADSADEDKQTCDVTAVNCDTDQQAHSSPISCIPNRVRTQSTVTFSLGKDCSWTRSAERRDSIATSNHSMDGRSSVLSRKLGHSRNTSSSSSVHLPYPTDVYVDYACGLFAHGSVPSVDRLCCKPNNEISTNMAEDDGSSSNSTSEPTKEKPPSECMKTPFDCYIDLFRCVDSEFHSQFSMLMRNRHN